MREVSLQAYGEEVRQLVAHGAYTEAIAIGRHILSLYPKHLPTYRLLGEACLEQGDFEEARQLFARALACDPEDVFSRAGLAIAHEKAGDLSLAIWHMERAYELAPGNPEIRQELQRLRSQRDGVSRPRFKFSAAAVARLYARSYLWNQAIQEFRALLQQNPHLIDVKVALAEALWNVGNRKDAAKLCQEILETYPHCLKANLILGEIWLHGERELEGRALLQLAQEIDPENATAQKLFGERSPLAARTVKVSRLEEVPSPEEIGEVAEEAPEPEEEEPLPAWLARAEIAPLEEEPVIEPAAGDEELAEPELFLEHEVEGVAPAVEEEAEATEGDEIPAWLQRIRERQREQEAEAAAAPQAEAEPEEIPEWLRRLREEQAAEETPPVPGEEEAAEIVAGAEGAAPEKEAVPGWLEQIEEEAEVEAEPLPDWLLSTEAAAAEGLLKEPSAEDEESGREIVEAEPESLLPEEALLPAETEAAPEPVAMEEEAAEVVTAEEEQPIAEAEPAPAPAVMEEEEVAEIVAAEEGPLVEAEPVTEPMVVEETAEVVPAEEEAPVPEPEAEAVAPESLLAQARALQDSGNPEGALDLYERLLQRDALLDQVLADLEGGASGVLAQSRTYTLIGDVCMKQGRLQKALEAYRRALDMLKQ